MNGTPVIVGRDDDDLELLKTHSLTDDQAAQAILVCGQFGFEVASLIPLLAPVLNQAARAIESLPDLGAMYTPLEAPPPARAEHRLRSMRKPTGKPWDRRGRR